MRSSESIIDLAKALAAFQAVMPVVPKTSDNPFFKSKYADLADVVTQIAPVAGAHGLSVSQHIEDQGDHQVLTTMLMHASGQHLSSSMTLYITKQDPQGQGSAVTYARRYAYCAVLGVVADADDDGNRASGAEHSDMKVTRTQPERPKKYPVTRSPEATRVYADEGKKVNEAKANGAMATEPQLKFLARLTKTSLEEATAAYGQLTAADASVLIDEMKENK